MIAAGSTLTFRVDGQVRLGWTDVGGQTPEDVRSEVIQSLMPYVGVQTIVINPLTSGLTTWTYNAIVSVKTKTAHGAADDVGAIVAHAFYVAANQLPTVVITNTVAPNTPGGVSDYPGILETINKTIGDLSAGLGRGVGSALDESGLKLTLVLVAVGAIVIGVVILKET